MSSQNRTEPKQLKIRTVMGELNYNLLGPHIQGTLAYGDAVKAENVAKIRTEHFAAQADGKGPDTNITNLNP